MLEAERLFMEGFFYVAGVGPARPGVISVDTKKKELVGNFHNPGRQWRGQGSPEPVAWHDFSPSFRAARLPLRHL
jgi:hypothetical protein